MRTRFRRILRAAKWGGKPCPVLRDVQACTDESCVWRLSEKSLLRLPKCTSLLKSREFKSWTQMWVDAREKKNLFSRYRSKLRQYQADVTALGLVNTTVLGLRREAKKLCKQVKHLDRSVRVPYGEVGFHTACRRKLYGLCKGTGWPVARHCKKLMQKGCKHLGATISRRLVKAAYSQGKAVSALAKKVGARISNKCLSLDIWMRRLLDKMFGTTTSRHTIAQSLEELQHMGRKLAKFDRRFRRRYFETIIHDGKDNWACQRTDKADIREQNFHCIKQTGPPLAAVVCKGDQFGRILASSKTSSCPTTASTHDVQRIGGELSAVWRARAEFARMSFGCKCPEGTQQNDGKCCRKGEIVVRPTAISQGRVVTLKPICQCPEGEDFVARTVGPAAWRRACYMGEKKINPAQCVAQTGFLFDYVKGRRVCCQHQDGECRRRCPPGHWRTHDGFCQTSFLQHCARFNASDYAGGHDVRCLLPVSEAVISEDECVQHKRNRWIKSDVFGESYCKRPREAWGKLNHPCIYDMSASKKNVRNCDTFAKQSFNVDRTEQLPLKISYFSFVSETVMMQEGSPSHATHGGRVMPEGSIPYWYSVFKPQYTKTDYDSVRKSQPQSKPGRKLLFDLSAEDTAAADLGSTEYLMEPTGQAPQAQDGKQSGYLSSKRKRHLQSGFYTTVGNFKMSSSPLLVDPYSIDSLVETDEGAGFDPVTTGDTDVIKELKAAAKDWHMAKDKKTPPVHSPGAGEGSTKKVCAPPAEEAKCFGSVHSGVALHKGMHHCLSGMDHAWFRTMCEQF
jgi:hypothetical protein